MNLKIQGTNATHSLIHIRGRIALLRVLLMGLSVSLSAPVFAGFDWLVVGGDIQGVPPTTRIGDYVALSADGSRLAVSTRTTGAAQYVQVYIQNGNSWDPFGLAIPAPNPNDQFGVAIALSGDGTRLAVATKLGSGPTGIVQVYTPVVNVWTQLGSDIPINSNFSLDASIALSANGNRLAVGAPQQAPRGAVKVYDFIDPNWVQVATDILGDVTIGDGFGTSVALSADGSKVAAGDPFYGTGATDNLGQVRVFTQNLSGLWVQFGPSIIGEEVQDQLGTKVAISGDGARVAANAPGYRASQFVRGGVSVFELGGGGFWDRVGQRLDGGATESNYGTSIALSHDGGHIAIGSPFHEVQVGFNILVAAGRVEVFKLDTTTWDLQPMRITGSARLNSLGTSVALSANGQRVVGGAPSSASYVRAYDYTFTPQLSLTCPPDVTGLSNWSTNVLDTGMATLSGDCPSGQNLSFTDTVTSNSCTFEISRVWTATDPCGGSVSCTQIISGSDTIAPIITSCPTNLTVECGDHTNTLITGTITTELAPLDCSTNTVVSYADSSAGTCPMIITRTWTAADECGNATSCVQTITVVDTTAPTLSCPADTTIDCLLLANTLAPATASDRCDASPTVSFTDSYAGDACTGTLTRTWTAMDACGNTTNCIQIIMIDDTTAPVLTCPADDTVECGFGEDPSHTGFATATDACDFDVMITRSDNTSGDPCTTTIMRTWTATDRCGNQSVCTQRISVVDSTVPVLNCPPDRVIDCAASTNVNATGFATASDNCASPTITFSNSVAGSVISRIWTARDACGNSTSCTQTITLEDTSPPIMACPPDLALECGSSTNVTSTGIASATDDCSLSVTVSFSDILAGDDCSRTITRTWTAKDGSGNSTSCVQNISVIDTTPPGGPPGPADWAQTGADIDGLAGDRSGTSVAISANGRRVAIGSDFNDAAGIDAGLVRVYDQVGGTWTQVGGDIPGELARDEAARSGLALNHTGTRVAIGAHLNDGNGSRSGHVRIFDLVGNAWTQVGDDIDGRRSGSEAGWSVDLSATGNRVIIGAIAKSPGHIQVFELITNSWIQVGSDIFGENSFNQFGSSVSISSDGNRIAAGDSANEGGGFSRGHVRVFDLIGGEWTQVGSDIDGEADGDQSGLSMELSADGSRVAIGAHANDGGGSNAGQVRIYELDGGVWTQLGGDIDGEASGDSSGFSVGFSSTGDRVAIGAIGNTSATGHVRVYELDGSAWTQLGSDIDGEAMFDQSGGAVALSSDGSRVAIGARSNTSNAGQVRVYELGDSIPAPFCPADLVVTNRTLPGTKQVYFVLEAVDNCSTPVIVCSPESGSVLAEGTTTVTCVAMDLCGNASTCRFDVVVIDDTFTDSDNDRVDDEWELAVFTNLTTVTLGSDFDADGMSDEYEFLTGTDPKDPNSRFEVVAQEPASVQSLNWIVVPGVTYNIEYSTDVTALVWETIAINITSGSFSDADAGRVSSAEGYYRVVVVP